MISVLNRLQQLNGNKMIRTATFVFVFLLASVLSDISAQEIEKSSKIELIGNTEYYLHTVNPGQTIYGISKAYAVSMDDIISANPDAKKGIKAGSTLKIPVIKSNEPKTFISHKVARGETLYEISFNYNVKVSEIMAVNPGLTEKISNGQIILIPVPEKKQEVKVVQNNLGVHIVQKNETIYSISKLYNTSIEDLKKINPGLTESIQVGQQIKLPIGKVIGKQPVKDTVIKKDTVITIECGRTGLQNSYRIALLIPFYLEKSHNIDTTDDKIPVTSYKSLSFIQFYEGVRIALDSLERKGMALTVYIYDVNESTNAEEFLKKKTELLNMDLIIGPFFMNNFSSFANWAKDNGINIVNPFTKKESAIKGNDRTFKLVASDSAQASKVLTFIAETYPGCNLIVVNRNADTTLSGAFRKNAALMNLNKKAFTFSLVDYSAKGFAGVSAKLNRDTINVVITLAEGEAFVSAYIRNLNETAHRYKIVLFGQSSWEQYPSLDLEYLMNLNLHIFESYFIDYSKPEIKDFIKKFRHKYNTDPDYYGFHGYDIMMYFSGALKKYGKNFQDCIAQSNPSLLISEYIIRKTVTGGYENISCMIYRFEDYKIVNAIVNPKKEIKIIETKKP